MAIDFSIDTFKSKATGGFARPNLFRCIVNFPAYAQADNNITSFMIKGASFPASTTGVIDVPWRGMQLPVVGDRVYDPITLTINNEVDHNVREYFLRWKNEMNNHTASNGLSNPSDYYSDIIVEQGDKAGNVTVRNVIRGAFPIVVSNIELDHESTNVIETFTVELRYLHWGQEGVTT